jgi:cytochrome P460
MRVAILIVTAALCCGPAYATAGARPVTANGIALFDGYDKWQVIAPSARPDKEQLRLILGNDLAVKSLQAGTRPFVDGAVLAKVAWTSKRQPRFPQALVPDKFVQVEFMVKDSRKYKATGGWGFARFLGADLQPYGKDPGFVQECYGCHMPMGDNDYVFTSLPPRP